METLDNLRYPLGKMPTPDTFSFEQIQAWVADIEKLPKSINDAVQSLSAEQLDTPYREGGWTLRQVVHHVADSHLNAYIRLKWAMTEDAPTIKPYDQDGWAQLPDSQLPVDVSLAIIANIHRRMLEILRGLSVDDFQRTFIHPGHGKVFRLGTLAAMYSWHGRHHVAHIEGLKARMGW